MSDSTSKDFTVNGANVTVTYSATYENNSGFVRNYSVCIQTPAGAGPYSSPEVAPFGGEAEMREQVLQQPSGSPG
jgi:hypothetical protein